MAHMEEVYTALRDPTVVYATLPQTGMSPKAAKSEVMSKLKIDQNPQNNLASFVTTEMEPEAEQLIVEGMRKNFIDMDQYRGSYDVQEKCVAMISNLWNAPGKPTGTACLGSSEAIMLAGLAMRSRWRQWRASKGLSSDKPNCVFGSNVQVCWHKMCKYFDIECREADVSAESLVLTPERAKPLIDENTIGVCPILGSTFNGEYEDIKGLHDMVVALNEEHGWQIPLHIDAASGGFIAPFLQPEIEWDFRLPQVKSINASGHKFGLVYAGLGWILFREPEDLPQELVFSVNYLGGDQASFTLNFSKSASAIVAQYYNFMRLGFQGYKDTMEQCMNVAQYLRTKLEATGRVKIVDKQHMPLVAWELSEEQEKRCSVFEIQEKLDKKGWSVPAYACSKGACHKKIMRVVVKNNFSMVLADLLLRDILEVFEGFDEESWLPTIEEKEVFEEAEFRGLMTEEQLAIGMREDRESDDSSISVADSEQTRTDYVLEYIQTVILFVIAQLVLMSEKIDKKRGITTPIRVTEKPKVKSSMASTRAPSLLSLHEEEESNVDSEATIDDSEDGFSCAQTFQRKVKAK